MSSIVNRYRIWCETEQTYVYTWATETPDKCPNNHEHTIANLVVAVESRDINTVYIDQLFVGAFQATTVCIDVPEMTPGDVYIQDVSWPCDVFIWKTQFISTTENTGDDLTIVISPDTPIGVITSPTVIGNKTLNVNSTVFNEAVSNGCEVKLTSGGVTENLGRIINMNSTTSTIMVEFAPTQVFNAGSVITFGIFQVKDYHLYHPGKEITFGDKGVAKKNLPANTITRCYYKNNNGLAKKLYLEVELYYA
jgi:hypothetical protein